MLCTAIKCIKNLSREDKEVAMKQKDPIPWAIERTCHYLSKGKCPKTPRFWVKHRRNPAKSSGN